jgi:hypothetical protein
MGANVSMKDRFGDSILTAEARGKSFVKASLIIASITQDSKMPAFSELKAPHGHVFLFTSPLVFEVAPPAAEARSGNGFFDDVVDGGGSEFCPESVCGLVAAS